LTSVVQSEHNLKFDRHFKYHKRMHLFMLNSGVQAKSLLAQLAPPRGCLVYTLKN